MIENLTSENFLVLAAKSYRNMQCSSTEEFMSDLKRIKYIKKIITKFSTSGVIDERLVLNHIIVLNNVFGPTFLCRVLFLKMLNQIEYIKPFLVYLVLLPKFVQNVNGKTYDTDDFVMNKDIIEKLRVIDRQSKK